MLGKRLVEMLQYKTRIKESKIGNVLPLTHAEYDITQFDYSSKGLPRSSFDRMLAILRQDGYYSSYIDYDIVINCAAYTDTYAIESSYESRMQSFAVNAYGPKNLALLCKCTGKKLIHISTDYVFSDYPLLKKEPSYIDMLSKIKNGSKCTNDLILHSWSCFDQNAFPANVYGMHKLIGEYMIKQYMDKDYTIIRTSWLYGHHKEKSFVHKVANKINKAILDGKKSIEWQANANFSMPTNVDDLCTMIYNAIRFNIEGTCHGCGGFKDNCDVVSSFEFANAVLSAMKRANNAKYDSFTIEPVDIAASGMTYPGFSRMLQLPSQLYTGINHTWQESLNDFVCDAQFSKYVS